MSDSNWPNVVYSIPFRGNLTDLGTAGVAVTNNGATVSADGLDTDVSEYAFFTRPSQLNDAFTMEVSANITAFNGANQACVLSTLGQANFGGGFIFDYGLEIFVSTNGAVTFQVIINGSTSQNTTAAGTVSTGTEFTISMEHNDSGSYRCWVDGVYQFTLGQPGNLGDAGANLNFGRPANGPNGQALIGRIRDFRFTSVERVGANSNYTPDARPYPTTASSGTEAIISVPAPLPVPSILLDYFAPNQVWIEVPRHPASLLQQIKQLLFHTHLQSFRLYQHVSQDEVPKDSLQIAHSLQSRLKNLQREVGHE